MKSFRILMGVMMFVLATFFISSVVSAQGNSNGNSGGLNAETAARIAADADLQHQIDTIELTPGPQGDPGTSSWVDGYETVSTTGSVQIGSDTADGTTDCNAANAGTIRFNNGAFEGCDGTAWGILSLTPMTIYAIGDTGPAGGIVFYTTDGGLHGLEAAPEDQGSARWGCRGTVTGADGAAVGTGAQNTADILAGCSEAGIAAEIADAYTLGGYDDWFLPSKNELNLLYQQRAVVGGFANAFYWSSTEDSSTNAWDHHLSNGGRSASNKDNPRRVRAVRAF